MRQNGEAVLTVEPRQNWEFSGVGEAPGSMRKTALASKNKGSDRAVRFPEKAHEALLSVASPSK